MVHVVTRKNASLQTVAEEGRVAVSRKRLCSSEPLRTQGAGSRLMAAAEDLARQKGCGGIWLDTFSFQAPGFYRKLGFSEFGHIADYPKGHQRHFFQKRLA